jgi:hypothetical protein
MSTETKDNEEMQATKPLPEHEWLKNLLGEWKVVTEFSEEPGGPLKKIETAESVKSLGGLWAYSEGKGQMPDGTPATTRMALGYDVSFKEYRGCFFGSMSSHLWKYVGTLSEDKKTMTLNCDGPSFTEEGKTAPYKDVIQLVDDNHRTLTSYGQDDKGKWTQFMKASYTRVA